MFFIYFTNWKRKCIRFISSWKCTDKLRVDNIVIFVLSMVFYLWIYPICVMTVIGCVNYNFRLIYWKYHESDICACLICMRLPCDHVSMLSHIYRNLVIQCRQICTQVIMSFKIKQGRIITKLEFVHDE